MRRGGQVAKAGVCKTPNTGSNPVRASRASEERIQLIKKLYNKVAPYRVVHVYFDGRQTVESYHRSMKTAKQAVKIYQGQTARHNRYEIQKREIVETMLSEEEKWIAI